MKSTNIDKQTLSANKSAKDVASILFEIGAIIFRPGQPFRYDSGILSPIYTDNRLIISYPTARKKIVKLLVDKVKEIGLADVIAGTATAGIPHAAFIAQTLNLPMIYVRTSPKDHGKGNQVEGKIKRGQTVIIIEDLISTAGSSVRVANAIKKLGGKIKDEIAIFNYQLKEATLNLKSSGIKLHALTDLEHAAQVAKEKGFLKEDQIAAILNWSKDPKNWGKKMGFE